MPELPEVESYARTFAEHGLRKAIRGVRVLDERILGTRRDAFVEALRGRKFVRVRRHGKHLFADAGAVWLHLHFGMSGDLSAYRDPEPEPRFARVIFDFASGRHLAFEDMRLFGVAELTPTPEAFIAEHRLGPDPLDAGFNLSTFRELLANRRGAIKSLLMSQEILAGVGNLYADEALFQASVDPRRPVPRLSSADVHAIHTRLRAILSVAVERRARGAELPPAWLYHHRETGERCPKCGGTIRRTVVFGRTTYFCATHQRR